MAGFVRAIRNGQFNESAQSLVNEGIAHYQSLRESLSRMTGKRGYNAYFENWTPSLMEDEGDETSLNELFVQETLDPRIESVMPILNRIHKKVAESVVDKELNKLAEWADSLTEEESIKSNNPVGIPEDAHSSDFFMDIVDNHDGDVRGIMHDLRSLGLHSEIIKFCQWAREQGIADIFEAMKLAKKIDLENDDENEMAYEGYLRAIELLGPSEVDEAIHTGAALKKYQDNRFAPQNEPAKPAPEKEVDEGSHEEQVSRLAAYNERMAGENPPIDLGLREVGNWAKVGHHGDPIKTAWYNIAKYGIRQNRFNNSVEKVMSAIGEFPDLEDEVYDMYDINQDEVDALYHAYETVYDQYDQLQGQQGMSEDLDANQKRVGQLGPTEKVGKKGAVGKLVGANENFINQADQAVTTEEDEMAEGILDNIKNMFKPKDPTPVTPITADDIAKGYQTQPEFAAQVKKIAMQQGISPEELIKQLQQQAGAGVAQNASVPNKAFGEGEHTQHGMRGRNPGANEFEHDFENDKIDNIHDKISKMLKRLEKPKHEPSMKDTDLGNTLHEAAPWEDEDEEDKDDKKPKDKKGSDGADHNGHSRAKHLAKQAIPKEKVKEGQEDFDAILRIIRK